MAIEPIRMKLLENREKERAEDLAHIAKNTLEFISILEERTSQLRFSNTRDT